MNLHEIPLKVMITMPQCAERRWRLHESLCGYGISDVIAEHPIAIHEINTAEYSHLPGKALPYVSQILTLKRVFSDARKRKVNSIWLFEDDAVLHPDFLELARRIRVPNNWRFLYLGGACYENAIRVNEHLLKPNRTLDLHCVVISGEMFQIIEDAFDAALNDKTKTEVFADVVLSELQDVFPAYLCRPNLSWQSTHQSDLNGRHYSNYKPNGEQWHNPVRLPETAIYTLWSKDTATWAGKEGHLQLKALKQSVRKAQQYFKRVVLHTDEKGEALLRDVYFDEVFQTLNNFEARFESNNLAKLQTISLQNEPFVHIDHNIQLDNQLKLDAKSVVALNGNGKTQLYSRARKWLAAQSSCPPYVRTLLNHSKKISNINTSILGGSDADFLKWYSEVCLEIFSGSSAQKTPANAAEIKAISEQILSLCLEYRGKRIQFLAKLLQGKVNSRTRNASVLKASQAPDSNGKSNGQSSRSESKYIEFAKRNHGWFVDLQKMEYKAVVGGPALGGLDYYRQLFATLGVMCEPHVFKNSDSQIARNKPLNIGSLIEMHDICSEAIARNVKDVLVIQYGATFSPNTAHLLAGICVPYDWQILYLGGQSNKPIEIIGRGIGNAANITNPSAVLFRRKILKALINILVDCIKSRKSADPYICEMKGVYPTYVCPDVAHRSPLVKNGIRKKLARSPKLIE